MRIAVQAVLAMVALGLTPSVGTAGEASYCVTCSEPQKTYLCQVHTPGSTPGDKAMQLYCMMRTAKDGKHRSCSANRTPTTQCNGTVKRYTLDLGGGLPGIRSAVRQYQGKTPTVAAPEPPAAPEKPKTLFGLTSKGVKKTSDAVVNATKKTGSRVGNAARAALDCVKKLFRKCGKDESEGTAAENQPVPLTPEKVRPE